MVANKCSNASTARFAPTGGGLPYALTQTAESLLGGPAPRYSSSDTIAGTEAFSPSSAIVTSSRLGLPSLRRAHIRLHSSRPGGRPGDVCSHQVGPVRRRGSVSPRIRVTAASALRRKRLSRAPASVRPRTRVGASRRQQQFRSGLHLLARPWIRDIERATDRGVVGSRGAA